MSLSRKFVVLTGDTPAEERAANVRRFEIDERVQVILVSTRAGGVGLNLSAATCAVFLELDPVPGVLLQAEDRIHRLRRSEGRVPEPVTLVYLVASGTADDSFWRRF